MKILYDGEAVGEVTTNRNLTLEEALDLAGIDPDEMERGERKYAYELFSMSYEEKPKKPYWTSFTLADAEDGQKITYGNNIYYPILMREFKNTGGISGHFFEQTGANHEDPEDASTWGPKTPDDVDWLGFVTISQYKEFNVIREEVVVCGSDWRKHPEGERVKMVCVKLRHDTWDEIIMPDDPRFKEAVDATA